MLGNSAEAKPRSQGLDRGLLVLTFLLVAFLLFWQLRRSWHTASFFRVQAQLVEVIDDDGNVRWRMDAGLGADGSLTLMEPGGNSLFSITSLPTGDVSLSLTSMRGDRTLAVRTLSFNGNPTIAMLDAGGKTLWRLNFDEADQPVLLQPDE